MAKDLDKLLSTLERGPLGYTELQERSRIPEGSFSRTLGQAIQSEQIEQDDAGRYRLSRAHGDGTNHTSEGENDGNDGQNEGSADGLTIIGDGSETEVDEQDVPGTLRKAGLRAPKRESSRADTLTVTITKEDGTTESIGYDEHRLRKG